MCQILDAFVVLLIAGLIFWIYVILYTVDGYFCGIFSSSYFVEVLIFFGPILGGVFWDLFKDKYAIFPLFENAYLVYTNQTNLSNDRFILPFTIFFIWVLFSPLVYHYLYFSHQQEYDNKINITSQQLRAVSDSYYTASELKESMVTDIRMWPRKNIDYFYNAVLFYPFIRGGSNVLGIRNYLSQRIFSNNSNKIVNLPRMGFPSNGVFLFKYKDELIDKNLVPLLNRWPVEKAAVMDEDETIFFWKILVIEAFKKDTIIDESTYQTLYKGLANELLKLSNEGKFYSFFLVKIRLSLGGEVFDKLPPEFSNKLKKFYIEEPSVDFLEKYLQKNPELNQTDCISFIDQMREYRK